MPAQEPQSCEPKTFHHQSFGNLIGSQAYYLYQSHFLRKRLHFWVSDLHFSIYGLPVSSKTLVVLILKTCPPFRVAYYAYIILLAHIFTEHYITARRTKGFATRTTRSDHTTVPDTKQKIWPNNMKHGSNKHQRCLNFEIGRKKKKHTNAVQSVRTA